MTIALVLNRSRPREFCQKMVANESADVGESDGGNVAAGLSFRIDSMSHSRPLQDIDVLVARWIRWRRFSLVVTALLVVPAIGFFLLWFRAQALAHQARVRAEELEGKVKKAKNLRDIERERFHVAWDAIDEINRELREAPPPGDGPTTQLRGSLIRASRSFY